MALHKQAHVRSFHSLAATQMKSPVRYTTAWIAILFTADVAMFVLASYVAGALSDRTWSIYWATARFLHSSIIFVAVWLLIFQLLGLYRRSFALSIRDEFYFTIVALILGVTPQFLIFTIMPSLSSSRLVLLLATLFAILFVGSVRSGLHALRSKAQAKQGRRILVVGHHEENARVSERLRSAGGVEIVCVGYPPRPRSLGATRRDLCDYVRTAQELHCDRLVLTQT